MNKRILVVCEDSDFLDLLGKHLKEAGYLVTSSSEESHLFRISRVDPPCDAALAVLERGDYFALFKREVPRRGNFLFGDTYYEGYTTSLDLIEGSTDSEMAQLIVKEFVESLRKEES